MFWLEITLIVFLLLSSAFFSSSETALFALDEMKIRKIKDRIARKNIKTLLKKSSLLLVTILTGNTAINIAVSSLLDKELGIESAFISTLVVTVILLFVGDIAPKTIALMRAEPIAAINSRILYPLFVLLTPITKLVEWLSNQITKIVIRLHKKESQEISNTHLSALQSIVSREGIFDKDEKRLIESVLNFAGREVWNIMTPRTKVFSIENETPIKEVVRLFKKLKLSKMPVYSTTDDNLTGYIDIRDIFQYVHNPEKATDKVARDMVRPMYFVPETKKLSEMLEDFRRKNIRIAAVVDEYGSSLGIVTIADVLGEIVGEVMDESFKVEKKVIRVSKNRFLVTGDISLDDFNTYFHSDISSREYETLAGYIIETAGDIPDCDYFVEIGDYKVIIKERSEKHIQQFLVEKVRG